VLDLRPRRHRSLSYLPRPDLLGTVRPRPCDRGAHVAHAPAATVHWQAVVTDERVRGEVLVVRGARKRIPLLGFPRNNPSEFAGGPGGYKEHAATYSGPWPEKHVRGMAIACEPARVRRVTDVPDADRIWQAHLRELRARYPGATFTVLRRRGRARPTGICTRCGAAARPAARRGPVPSLCARCGHRRRS